MSDYKYMGGLGNRGTDRLRPYTHGLTDEEKQAEWDAWDFRKKLPSGSYIDVPTSEEVKLMKKAFKEQQVELRWYEIWVSDKEVLKLFFEYSFSTQDEASKFLGDLLMGVRNHSDLVVAWDIEDDDGVYKMNEGVFGEIAGEFYTIEEECRENNLDPSDFKLKEINGFNFVTTYEDYED